MKNNCTYSIEGLIRKFSENSEKSKKFNQDLLKQFIENNPNQPIPEWFLDDFNINDALFVICSEILNLKNKTK